MDLPTDPGQALGQARLRGLAALIVLAAAMGLTVARLAIDHAWISSHPEFYRADRAWPLLFSYDGWWYLRLAREGLGASGFGSVPALSALLMVVAKALGQPLEVAAFWLPPLLTLSLLPAVFLFGRRLAGNMAGAAAVLATAFSPYWLKATGMGMLDTKCLIPALLTFAALALSGFAEAPRRRAVALLAAFGLIAAVATWWWKPAAGFCLLSLLAALAARAAKSRTARLAVLFLGVVCAACVVLVATKAHEALPELPRDVLRYAERHAALVFRTDADQASMAASIVELAPASFAELSRLAAGGVAAMLAALAGLVLSFVRQPRKTAPLAALALALVMAMPARRLILLFTPAMGLGFGVFAAWLAGLATQPPADFLPALFRRRPVARACCALTLAAATLIPAAHGALTRSPEPPFTRAMDTLALAVRRAAPPGTVIWSWWDYGYFLQDRAKLPTFFDGGSQTEDDCFVAAFPLACGDPVLAANWMRFFARAGQGEFGRIAAGAGSRERAFDLLVRLFSGKEDRAPILAELSGGLSPDQAAARFFPDISVCLVLPRQFFDFSGYWLAYASAPGVKPPAPVNHIDVLDSKGLTLDLEKGQAGLPDAALAKGYKYVPSAVELGGTWNGEFLYQESVAEPILFFQKGSPLAYITDKPGARTLAFRLLAPTGFNDTLFKTVWYDPQTGGAWMVGAPRPGG